MRNTFPDLWALMPERATQAVQAWRALPNDDDAPRAPVAGPMRPVTVGQVVVVQIIDFIDQRYWASTTAIGQLLDQLRDDPNVKVVVLEFDSPGGSVYGVPELADKIRALREVKRVIAISNSLMASAAYWLACQAEEVWCTPGGEVGSIGVWNMHVDASGMMEQMGWKPTLISAGKFKVEGHPYGPLEESAQVFMQQRVDEYYGMFVSAVAKGRGVTPAAVRAGYGEGRVLGATQAKAEGLIDRIGTMDDLLAKLGAKPSTSSRRALLERRQAFLERTTP